VYTGDPSSPAGGNGGPEASGSWGEYESWESEANATLLGELPADVLQFLSWLEADGSPGRNANLLARSRVSADASLPGFDLEDAETSKFDPLATHHRCPHGIKHGVDGDLGFDLRDLSQVRDLVHDVEFDHDLAAIESP
jgi:hypothetical protein